MNRPAAQRPPPQQANTSSSPLPVSSRPSTMFPSSSQLSPGSNDAAAEKSMKPNLRIRTTPSAVTTPNSTRPSSINASTIENSTGSSPASSFYTDSAPASPASADSESPSSPRRFRSLITSSPESTTEAPTAGPALITRRSTPALPPAVARRYADVSRVPRAHRRTPKEVFLYKHPLLLSACARISRKWVCVDCHVLFRPLKNEQRTVDGQRVDEDQYRTLHELHADVKRGLCLTCLRHEKELAEKATLVVDLKQERELRKQKRESIAADPAGKTMQDIFPAEPLRKRRSGEGVPGLLNPFPAGLVSDPSPAHRPRMSRQLSGSSSGSSLRRFLLPADYRESPSLRPRAVTSFGTSVDSPHNVHADSPTATPKASNPPAAPGHY